MIQAVRDLVDAAVAGRPVYISAVRECFDALPEGETTVLTARLEGYTGDDRAFAFRLPRADLLDAGGQTLVTEFVLAGMYNIISTLGGRGLAIEVEPEDRRGAALAAAFEDQFGIGRGRFERQGYGRAVNVAERVDEAVAPEHAPSRGVFRVVVQQAGARPTPEASTPGDGIADLCDRATSGLQGTAICGMDIGGTDIKLCLAVDGRIARLVEYDWFPAAFTEVDQIIDPVLLLVRLVRLEAAAARDAGHARALEPILGGAYAAGAGAAEIGAAVLAGEALVGTPPVLDAIGVCFPDVVVHDKIVGGEVYKTRGMRDHLGTAYEGEFRRLSGLDAALRALVRPGGVVGIINDGPMAAFTAAIELGVTDRGAIADGVFAHTLGTELGTGWVTEDGAIPDIPLEVYNCVIDLGSYPERRFAPDDVRSVNNFNTKVPGTLQKYTSQSGVFRLAAKYLPDEDPALFDDLLARGLLAWNGGSLVVRTDPRDMRKPLLEFLMQAAAAGGHPAVERIFREVGEFLGVAWHESKWLLDAATDERILFGRLVKRRACFDLMAEGGRSIAPAMDLVVADDELANTDLMRQLRDSDGYTVAQFGQAIGAVHYANFRLNPSGGAVSVAGVVEATHR